MPAAALVREEGIELVSIVLDRCGFLAEGVANDVEGFYKTVEPELLQARGVIL